MQFVSLPSGQGWHFVNVEEIVAIRFGQPGKSTVFLTGGIMIECSEETHAIHKRIEECLKQRPK
jgi:hypothetical protein